MRLEDIINLSFLLGVWVPYRSSSTCYQDLLFTTHHSTVQHHRPKLNPAGEQGSQEQNPPIAMCLKFALLAYNKTYGAVGIDKEIIHTHLRFVVAAQQQAILQL